MPQSITPIPINTLLERSDAFETSIRACFPDNGYVLGTASPVNALAATACLLCAEHAAALRAAFAIECPNSGSAVLRLEYESLLRAAWLLYGATPIEVDKLTCTLDLDAEQRAKNLPGYQDMLNAVVKAAPEGLSAPLAEFNQYSRHALNSFVHSGIHPLTRSRNGYPLEMAITVVRLSNGLMHIAYRLLASLSGSQRRMDRVTRTCAEFSECLPAHTMPRPQPPHPPPSKPTTAPTPSSNGS